VYTKVLRNTRDPLLQVFDTPEGFVSTAQRNVTTTPTQALLLFNSNFMLQQAQAFADRLVREGSSDTERVDRAFRLALGRAPTADERRQMLAFLEEQARRINPKPTALATFQHGRLQYREGRAAVVQPGGMTPVMRVADSPMLPAGDFTLE